MVDDAGNVPVDEATSLPMAVTGLPNGLTLDRSVAKRMLVNAEATSLRSPR